MKYTNICKKCKKKYTYNISKILLEKGSPYKTWCPKCFDIILDKILKKMVEDGEL
jgi:hypothetical protein